MVVALDMNSREISIGSYVRYINTGTKGIVRDILEKEGKIWVLLDNNLMYRPEKLEVIEHKKKKDRTVKEKIEDILEKENIKEIESNIDACGAG
ncbi:DUF2098 domain-containing protein [Methanofervidicoccus abyssi]|uniref:DUF2098 domain-containing protein n=1 Tax=Methanofervidicoccus abyssi TaxID=2082189 RepID=A0A401HS37_9EURY|nr:DUF2098 domain-containing protein [Methanofervidicoccus abyssi]GBF37022.1 hypothetical protein MHHB_P1252 [Methanofervidicoccus abyssi]